MLAEPSKTVCEALDLEFSHIILTRNLSDEQENCSHSYFRNELTPVQRIKDLASGGMTEIQACFVFLFTVLNNFSSNC